LWWIASGTSNAELSGERDDVLRVGTSVLRAVTELDYTKPDEIFDRSIAVSTPDFGKQITADRDARRQVLIQTKTVVTTTVLDAAVDELNVDQGKASVMAALRVQIKQGEVSVPKVIRIEANLTRLEENGQPVWKLSGIDPVPVVG
jgi:Mce-associated membrane protein